MKEFVWLSKHLYSCEYKQLIKKILQIQKLKNSKKLLEMQDLKWSQEFVILQMLPEVKKKNSWEAESYMIVNYGQFHYNWKKYFKGL